MLKQPIEGWDIKTRYKAIQYDIVHVGQQYEDNTINHYNNEGELADEQDEDAFEKMKEEGTVVEAVIVYVLLGNHVTHKTEWIEINDLFFIS